MKRRVFDTLRRGLDNAVANWHLIAIRVAEIFVFLFIFVVAALVTIVPMLVSIGVAVDDLDSPEDFESLLGTLILKWVWLLWIFLGVSVLLLVFVMVHSFVEAGCARVAVDADRVAGPAVDGPRARYRVFSMQRWMTGGRDGWWTIFWIYNFAWGLAGLILLIPLLPTAAIMFIAREEAPVMMATGCIGIVVTLMLFIVVGIVTSLWTTRATADWAVHGTGAAASLSGAWASIKADLGRHILIALAVIVIAMAGSSFFASFGYIAAMSEVFGRSGIVNVFTLPVRFFAQLCSWIFSAFVTSWYLAAYAALAVEGRK